MEQDFEDQKPPRRLGLKAAIAESGLKQKELADIIGRHEQTVSQIVAGRINPTKAEVYRICRELKMHPRALFGELYCWDDWMDFARRFGFDYVYPIQRRQGICRS